MEREQIMSGSTDLSTEVFSSRTTYKGTRPQFVKKLRKKRGDQGACPQRGHLLVERGHQVDGLVRALPGLKVDDNLHVVLETLCHEVLDFGDSHSAVVGREWVLGGEVELTQLGRKIIRKVLRSPVFTWEKVSDVTAPSPSVILSTVSS